MSADVGGDQIDVGDTTESSSAIGRQAHNQSVNVTVTPVVVPPELKEASYRELQYQLFGALERTNSAIQHLEERFYEFVKATQRHDAHDEHERKDRQVNTDVHRAQLTGRVERVERWVVGIVVVLVLLVLLLIARRAGVTV